jgi:predicted protein tyrosine phosphatase
MNHPEKLLFICSENQMRSPTAEAMYQDFPGYEVKSAGTELSARIPLTQEHVQWADIIFVMEPEHLERVQLEYSDMLAGKRIICLNIPDIYSYMEPELIDDLKAALRGHVNLPG